MNQKPSGREIFAEPSRLMEAVAIRRPLLSLTDAEIVKLHAAGKPVPMTEYTVVRPVQR